MKVQIQQTYHGKSLFRNESPDSGYTKSFSTIEQCKCWHVRCWKQYFKKYCNGQCVSWNCLCFVSNLIIMKI